MKSVTLRALGATLLTIAAVACSNESTAPIAEGQVTLKNGGTTPTPAPAPAPAGIYTGTWVETGVPIFDIGNGRAQQIWIEFSVTSAGSSYSGRANRYVRYFQDGVVTVDRVDLGTPGRVSATTTAQGLTVFVTKVGEQKLNLGYSTIANATSDTLTVIAPKSNGGSAFVKQ